MRHGSRDPAHDNGANVAIIEKMDRPGGNSSLSTGSVPAAGSKYQKAAGIDDKPEAMVEDLMAISGGTDAPELVRRMAEVSAATVEWLIDDLGARMQLITAYKHIGHSVPRLHAPISRRGQDLVDDLMSFVAEARDSPRGRQRRAGADRRGRRYRRRRDERWSSIRADKVVLAVNGYAGNRELVARFCPEIAGASYFGALGSTGEAMLWGETVGAGLANMAAYQGYAAVAHPHGSLLSWTTIEKGGLILNGRGDASATRASAIRASPRTSWLKASSATRCSMNVSSRSRARRKSSSSCTSMAA